MPNLMVTDRCNQGCTYCFARDWTAGHEVHGVTFERLDRYLDFLERSGYQVLELIGGEPTIGPTFPAIVRHALRRGFRIKLFTNGLMPPASLRALTEAPADSLQLLVNVNERTGYSAQSWCLLEKNLASLGDRAGLGSTLYQVDFDLSDTLTLIERHGLRHVLRVGLAQPILGVDNAHLDPPDYLRIAETLTAQAEHAADHDVRVGLDCGFVRCMFDARQLARLRLAGADVQFVCGPIMDVSPQLEVFNCFPLSRQNRVPLDDFPDMSSMTKWFQSDLEQLRANHAPEACLQCEHFLSGGCAGGCLAHVLAGRFPVPEG